MEVYKFTGFGVVILLILDLTVLALKLPQLQGQNTELVSDSITLDYVPIHRRRRSHSTEPPEEIHTKFTSNDENIDLKLWRTKWQQDKSPVRYFRLGMQYENKVDKETEGCISIYVDFDSKATALIDFCETHRSIPAMLIELPVNNTTHVIMTSSSTDDLDQVTHKLYRVGESEPWMYKDYTPSETDKIQSKIASKNDVRDKDVNDVKRRRRADLSSTHTVELLLIIDYSLYMFWYDQTSGINRQQQAFNNIRSFYAFIVAGMDVRYQGLASAGLNIRVKLVDILVMTTPQDSPWIEENLDVQSLGSRGSFNGRTALMDFDTWIATRKAADPNFPKYDHAQLLTARDLQLDGSLGAAGYANLGAICTGKSQSIVEDHFNFLSVSILTHELGHSLGAVHDGDDNSCRANDLYIMTAVSAVRPGPTARNPWLFSACSGSEIRNKLTQLNSNGGNDNCLVTDDNNNEVVATGDLLGQRYHPDEQCRLSIGTNSFSCKSRHISDGYSTLCTGLWCAVNGKLDNCTLVIPADGTTCGNKKWCVNGLCESSNNAPEADETCMFGDQLGLVEGVATCSAIVTSDLSRCYYSATKGVCCSSCESRKTNIPGCDYGDTADCSAITSANAWNCYNTSISASQCCQTCHSLKRTDLPTTCAYGDSLSNCRATDSVCRMHPDGCCDTCRNLVITSTATTTRTTSQTTSKPSLSEGPEAWVIAVGAGGGAVVLIAVIIGIIICCRRSNTEPTPSRRPHHHRNRHRHNDRVRGKPPPYESHIGSAPYGYNTTGMNYGGHRARY